MPTTPSQPLAAVADGDALHAGAGSPAFPKLFSPLQLGNLALPNRVVMAAMSSSLADSDGFVTPELVAFLRARAEGGCGLVIVEFTCVDSRWGLGELRQPRIDLDAHVAGHAALVRAITDAGARACLQLHLPGQYVVRDPATGRPAPFGTMAVAPSDVYAPAGRQLARALEAAEVEALVQSFAAGARRALRAGYQAIEVHGAHGYLPMAFMSPRKNFRDDAWGGDFERRLAFPLAVVRALRAVLDRNQPLIYRLSAIEFAESGLSEADMACIVPRLAEAGCTALHVSTGTVEGALDKIVDPMSSTAGWRFPLARRLREASGLPVMAVGPVRWPQAAEAALCAGDVDLIALGRPLLADPHWARKSKEGRLAELTPCTSCNWCMDRVRQHAAIGCAENPGTGRETEEAAVRATAGDVAAVVGGGPAGLHAALSLDAMGYRTHLFEAQPTLGGGIVVSAAPPFKDPLLWYRDHLRHRIEASGVVLHLGRPASAAELLALKPALAIIATGSEPRPWRDVFPGAGLPLLDATDVLLDISLLPRREGTDGAGHQGPPLPVVVYGGGETGCETAEFLSAAGWHVVLVTRSRLDDLARAAEPMYRRQLRKRLAANGHIRVVPLATLAAIHGDRVSLQLAEGDGFDLRATALVMAQGRASSDALVAPLRAAGVVHAVVGDARSIGRIGDAVHAAHEAVRVLAGGLSKVRMRLAGTEERLRKGSSDEPCF